ncbi:hypothetical protein BDF14DRAFT_9690 [Spinellus fusiger]|nr:hypothetical protein BDF14DRAFT_9690 [Spinellus fusiger]
MAHYRRETHQLGVKSGHKNKRKQEREQVSGETAHPLTIDAPEILQRVVIGINQVTGYMESVIRDKYNGKTTENLAVFVCKRDTQPPHLVAHLLSMAAIAECKIISLPKASEEALALVLGVNRACTLAIRLNREYKKEEALYLSVDQIKSVEAPWLVPTMTEIHHFKPTNIKILETTAPVEKKGQKRSTEESKKNPPKKMKL